MPLFKRYGIAPVVVAVEWSMLSLFSLIEEIMKVLAMLESWKKRKDTVYAIEGNSKTLGYDL